MRNILLSAGLAMLAVLSSLVVRRMIAHGVMDVPGARSSHDRPTPKGGGWGILAALLAGLAAEGAMGLVPPSETIEVAGLGVAALLLGTVAWADDLAAFGFWIKLAAQLVAAMILVLSGVVVERFGPVHLGVWGVPVTLAWMMLAINAMNFIDGLNGLASGCALIASAAVSAIALIHGGGAFAVVATLPLAAGIAGFLPYNFPDARIFMGDVGSQVLGLVLAATAAPMATLPGTAWGVLVVPMLLAPILADVVFTLVRRAVARRKLAEAHRGHLYQLVHRSGWSAPRVTVVHLALTTGAAMLAGVASRSDAEIAWLCVLMEAAAILGWMAAALLVARRSRLGVW